MSAKWPNVNDAERCWLSTQGSSTSRKRSPLTQRVFVLDQENLTTHKNMTNSLKPDKLGFTGMSSMNTGRVCATDFPLSVE